MVMSSSECAMPPPRLRRRSASRRTAASPSTRSLAHFLSPFRSPCKATYLRHSRPGGRWETEHRAAHQDRGAGIEGKEPLWLLGRIEQGARLAHPMRATGLHDTLGDIAG